QETDAAIRGAIESALTAARTDLSKTALREAISAAIANTGLQLVAENAVVLNAEYEQTGRLLNNTDSVSIESHQALELREMRAEVQGELDG
ncbi:MAG: hypothetical protein L0229_27210, partial [Blastocatellia bacterium]|nr:hypothetical protein [Blastocatellia bacterium]